MEEGVERKVKEVIKKAKVEVEEEVRKGGKKRGNKSYHIHKT